MRQDCVCHPLNVRIRSVFTIVMMSKLDSNATAMIPIDMHRGIVRYPNAIEPTVASKMSCAISRRMQTSRERNDRGSMMMATPSSIEKDISG